MLIWGWVQVQWDVGGSRIFEATTQWLLQTRPSGTHPVGPVSTCASTYLLCTLVCMCLWPSQLFPLLRQELHLAAGTRQLRLSCAPGHGLSWPLQKEALLPHGGQLCAPPAPASALVALAAGGCRCPMDRISPIMEALWAVTQCKISLSAWDPFQGHAVPSAGRRAWGAEGDASCPGALSCPAGSCTRSGDGLAELPGSTPPWQSLTQPSQAGACRHSLGQASASFLVASQCFSWGTLSGEEESTSVPHPHGARSELCRQQHSESSGED